MAKHFHGIASRISQGQVDARVSLLSMHQLFSGQVVTDPADRLFFARLLVEYLEQGGRQQTSLETLGITATGAWQFLSGLPVSSAEDRQCLTRIAHATLGGSQGRIHTGGANSLSLDDSAGREK
jgi:hypothetical protein